MTLSNNSIVNSETGNVVVWLYDANDNLVDVQQSYVTENDLITLMPEERKMMTFAFDQPGVRVKVSYGDLVLDGDDASLNALDFSGLATLKDFELQADGSYAASVETLHVLDDSNRHGCGPRCRDRSQWAAFGTEGNDA